MKILTKTKFIIARLHLASCSLKQVIALLLVSIPLLVLTITLFTNPSKAYAAQATVDLQTAAPFAILAGTPAITESGAHTSVVTGNVGLSPATAVDIGLYCSQVTGTIYGVDAAYTGGGFGTACFAGNPPLSNKTLVDNAKLDLTAAYIDVAGRTPVNTINTELGGQTLVPGVYTSGATTFGITAGTPLVLDAQGDPSAVFIFQVASSDPGLTVGNGSVVQLTGQAQACNVFWRVDSAAIGTTAVFKGNVLALNSITVANGANIEGRLLARNGQVTLINDTITRPTCVAAAAASPTPKLPNTGFAPNENNIPWYIPVGIFVAISTLLVLIQRKDRFSSKR